MLHEFFQRGISALKDGVRATLTPYRLRKVRPGIDTRDKVRQQLGSATMTWSDQRGDTWEYACTPFGTQNYMIDFAPDGVVLRIRPTLTEPHFARILVGMDKEDVRRMLGKAAHEHYFPRKNEVVWDWKITSESSGDTYFNVHFDFNDLVYQTSRSVEPRS